MPCSTRLRCLLSTRRLQATPLPRWPNPEVFGGTRVPAADLGGRPPVERMPCGWRCGANSRRPRCARTSPGVRSGGNDCCQGPPLRRDPPFLHRRVRPSRLRNALQRFPLRMHAVPAIARALRLRKALCGMKSTNHISFPTWAEAFGAQHGRPEKGSFWDKRHSQIRPAFRRPVLLSRNRIPGVECIGARRLALALPNHQAFAGGFHNSFGHLFSGVDFENPLDLGQ